MENNWWAEWESEVKVSGHAFGWMQCWGHSNIQGFGQVQIKSWAQRSSFKTCKASEGSWWRYPSTHALFIPPRSAPLAVQAPPRQQQGQHCSDCAGGSPTPPTQAGTTSGTGMEAAGWHLPLPACQQGAELN